MYAKIQALVVLLLISVQCMSQMGAAQKVNYDIDTTIKFNVSVPILWDVINNSEKWNEIGSGHIRSVTLEGELPSRVIKIGFEDGTAREMLVAQYQPDYRFIVLKIREPLSALIEDNIIAVTALTEGKGLSSLHIMIKVDAPEKEKKAFLQVLQREIGRYASRLEKLL